ncbi:hypothetical protein HHI36_001645 [Cryptolaemus montrouzieri]|uniref:Reverse transcriptase domain-containing protein n=1 Tax=Cryptolaemus montrouzieri TaxID=559131 RepID=A0ABD2P8Z8_9CUCU
MRELDYSIKIKKSLCPGLDVVTYSMLKHSPTSLRSRLLHLLNVLTPTTGEPPPPLKTSLIIPFAKPNKTLDDEGRMEGIIEDIIGDKNQIYWFRRERSTMDCVGLLTSYAYRAFSSGKIVVAIFVDIKKAYHGVGLNILYNTCVVDAHIPYKLCNLVY